MCSILEQGLLIDQELAARANLDANDNRANADMSATDSPPKVPTASNQPRQHHHYQSNDHLSPSHPNPPKLKGQASSNLKVDCRPFLGKFEELYRRILRRDRKLHDLKGQNQ